MKGFTLVEILVVITVMGILATLGIINYRTFQATQVLNEGVGLVQSTLRVAQSNATTAVKCQDSGGATWFVSFEANKKTLNLQCKTATVTTSTHRIYTLPANIEILGIVDCDTFYPFLVNFSPLFGKVIFESGASCITNQNSISIKLTNTKSGEAKNVTVTSGGSIDVQK